MAFQVPEDVRGHIVSIFSELNDSISQKLASIPNVPEESLDISFIENLSRYSTPQIVAPNWAVRIAAHFIGNIRHRRRYEVADLGIVIVFKRSGAVVSRKLILLQSKRLYPINNDVIEFDDFDYDLGLALITDRDAMETSIFSQVKFVFDSTSNYGALRANSRQCAVIQEHLEDTNVPVHYLMYNPLVLPWSISYPVTTSDIEFPEREFGARVISSERVHTILNDYTGSAALNVADLCNREGDGHIFGLSLEHFIDEVIQCREGYRFDGTKDVGLQRLFSRKSGPIFCVVEIVIEGDG